MYLDYVQRYLFIICTVNIENGQLMPSEKFSAANNNDGISKKGKNHLKEALKESVVESNSQ